MNFLKKIKDEDIWFSFRFSPKYHFCIRNHWSKMFNSRCLFLVQKEWQGFYLHVYQLGFLNIVFCFMINEKPMLFNK